MLPSIITAFIQALSLVVIVDVVLSWVAPASGLKRMLGEVTAPIYAPVHAILSPQRTGGIDFAPMVVIFGAQAIGNMLIRLTY